MNEEQDRASGPPGAGLLHSDELQDRLRHLGYDIEPPRPGDPPHGGIVARRDLDDRSVLLAIDAGGRFRAEITWLVGEWPSGDEIAGVPVRIVDRVTRSVSVAGQVDRLEQLVEVVRGLPAIVPWATATGEESPPATPP